MPMHPVVNTLIWIACIASFLYPIIPLIRYDATLRKTQRKFLAEMDEEIRKFKADPENYKAKQR